MHCSAVPSMFDILQTPPYNMFENPWIIFILTAFHCTHTHTHTHTQQQQHRHPLLTPVSRCQRLPFNAVLEAPHTRPPPTLLLHQDRREYLGYLAFFFFSRSLWLHQDRLEDNFGPVEKKTERVRPRVVFSHASVESENVSFSLLFFQDVNYLYRPM